jgi:DNA-binding transcriptional LysR family regulator
MDRSSDMAVFVAAIEAGGFTAAARQLGQTPSAVSKHVARLEDRLGARLINRTTRRLSLTAEGEAYFARAQRILADIEEAEQAVSQSLGTPQGELRVNVGIAFGQRQIVPLIPVFQSRHPRVRIKLTLTDRVVDLVESGDDVAVRIAEVKDSSLVARKLADNRRIVCASPGYLEHHGRPERPVDLQRHNCLALDWGGAALDEWEFHEPEGPIRVRVGGDVVANTSEPLYDLALAGRGIIRFAEFMVGADVRAGRLIPLLQEFDRGTSPPIMAVYPHKKHLSPRVRAFVDFLVEKFTPVPPWHCTEPILS